MSIPPESIRVGQCYLVEGYQGQRIRRVLRILSDGQVQYESRVATPRRVTRWRLAASDRHTFAAEVTRLVPCNWTPETDDREKGMR